MDLTINFNFEKADFDIQHGETIIFLGSCFSDEISKRAHFHGFKVSANPFGVVFHPSLLSQFIDQCVEGKKEERIVKRKDVFLSWDANATLYDLSVSKISQKLQARRVDFLNQIKTGKVLFVTFGTAWAYHLGVDNTLVANCHKFPGTDFYKELISINQMEKEWTRTLGLLAEMNPSLKVVFTVSPVRHLKDGVMENTQSKAILIELVRRLVLTTKSSYFPSFEIMMDELRDYRFYKTDHIHPSDEAVSYIWQRFESTYFKDETRALNKKIALLKKGIGHRSIHQKSRENEMRKQAISHQIQEFLKLNPSIEWIV
jgi:hypothetical protein